MAKTRSSRKAPWDRKSPTAKKPAKKTLSGSEKAEARSRAKRAGRPYPNLVDNMAVARKKPARSKKTSGRKATGKKTAGKKPGRKTTARKTSGKKKGSTTRSRQRK